MSTFIETPRLLLSPFEESDALDMFAWAGDARQTRLMGWPTHRDPCETSLIIERFLDHQNQDPETFDMPLALRDRSTRQALGSIGLHLSTSFGDGALELGYILRHEAQGKGYVYEAGSALIAFAFRTYRWVDAVCARVHPENGRSIKCLERLGMQRTGDTTCVAPQLATGPVTVLAYRLERGLERTLL